MRRDLLVFLLGVLLATAGCASKWEQDDDSAADDDASDDDAADDDAGDDDAADDDSGDDDSGEECSGHGMVMNWMSGDVCACAPGFVQADPTVLECVPTQDVCQAGAIDSFDVDGDGVEETSFQPSLMECLLFELVNRTRANHDDEGHAECHAPLMFDLDWSAHARNHSMLMYEQESVFFDDVPPGNAAQNAGHADDGPQDMMAILMAGDHCPEQTPHCTLMGCGWANIGVGVYLPDDGPYFTQNFF
jgi:hypothetical protein